MYKSYEEEYVEKKYLTPTGKIKKAYINSVDDMQILVGFRPDLYKMLPEEVRNDKNLIKKVLRFMYHNRYAVSQYFNEENKDDRDLILECCKKDVGNFEHASPRLRGDKDFVKEVLKLNKGGYFIKHMDGALKRDVEFLNEILDIDPTFNIAYYCTITDPHLAARCVSGNSYARERISKNIIFSLDYLRAERDLVWYCRGKRATETGWEEIPETKFNSKEEAMEYSWKQRQIEYHSKDGIRISRCDVYGK